MQTKVDIASLRDSVCEVICQRPLTEQHGHGVFLRDDVILTSWSLLSPPRKNVEIITRQGAISSILEASPLNTKHSVLDIALVQLTYPIGRVAADYSIAKASPEAGGRVITGEADEILPCRAIDTASRLRQDFYRARKGIESFACDTLIRPDYTGAPVFDENGQVCSIVTEVRDAGGFYGPSTVELSKMLQRRLGL